MSVCFEKIMILSKILRNALTHTQSQQKIDFIQLIIKIQKEFTYCQQKYTSIKV